MNVNKTLTITLSAMAFLILSAGVAYAASDEGFKRFEDLTEEQKQVLQEAHDLREQGDFEAAKDLILNSGLELPMPGPHAMMRDAKFSEEFMQRHEAIKEAIESGDYEAFVELTEDSPKAQESGVEIDEDTFNKLVEAHSLRVEGDHEGARAIMEEIGFEGRPGFPHPHPFGKHLEEDN